MAGKLHKDYKHYAIDQDGLVPNLRQVRAYAEGYNAQRAGKTEADNPHPDWQAAIINSDWTAWAQGFLDANAGDPSTHVGGPAGIPPEPTP